MRNVEVLENISGNAVRSRINFELSSTRPSIHLVEFTSPVERPDLPNSPKSLKARNQKYPLRIYLPPLKKCPETFNRVYILFNGLAESDPGIYDELGKDLSERKEVPVILLPLPLHFCRHHAFESDAHDPYRPSSKDVSVVTSQRILQSLIADPLRLVNGFEQTLEETRLLVNLIRTGTDPYFERIFARDCRFTLFGYSLGGFSALAFLLLHPDHVDNVFLLESGGHIDQINAGILFHRSDHVARTLWNHYYVHRKTVYSHEPLFAPAEKERRTHFGQAVRERKTRFGVPTDRAEESTIFSARPEAFNTKDLEIRYSWPYKVFLRSEDEAREIWGNMMESLYRAFENNQLIMLRGEEAEIFKRIYLGYQRIRYKRDLKKYQNKILIISGGADDIFPTSRLVEVGPETGLALIQIPGVTHWLKYRSSEEWKEWQETVVDFLETFCKASRRWEIKK